MLKIQKKNSPLDWLIVIIVSAITATVTTLVVMALLNAWTTSLCGKVQLTDYLRGSAPSKCQALWWEGKL